MQEQRFQFGHEVETMAVRHDVHGQYYYSQLDDIQDLFPEAMRFKVNGTYILFLHDPSGKRYEPNRIAHYPNDTVQVFPERSRSRNHLSPDSSIGFSHDNYYPHPLEYICSHHNSTSIPVQYSSDDLVIQVDQSQLSEPAPVPILSTVSVPDRLDPTVATMTNSIQGTEPSTQDQDVDVSQVVIANVAEDNQESYHNCDEDLPISEEGQRTIGSSPPSLPTAGDAKMGDAKMGEPKQEGISLADVPFEIHRSLSTLVLESDTPDPTTVETNVQVQSSLVLSSISPSSTFSSSSSPSFLPSSNMSLMSTEPSVTATEISIQISQLHHQLSQSTDRQSEYHTQLLSQLLHMLKLQGEAKERDEELQRMQHIMHDRLTVLQQNIEAVLVQNYELHEYPIPRLFVVLPEYPKKNHLIEGTDDHDHGANDGRSGVVSATVADGGRRARRTLGRVKGWRPSHVVQERFRLYFLCECGEHSKADSEATSSHSSSGTGAEGGMIATGGATSASASATAAGSVYRPSEHRIHLANHEGYELVRPTQFFQQYGPYVLGMLLILKHCLTATAIVSPAVGHLSENLGKLAEGMKGATENTMEAVNVSIDFLAQRLTAVDNVVNAAGVDCMDSAVAMATSKEGGEDGLSTGSSGDNKEQNEKDLFKHLDALEGADLRRLESFLRNKDQDKVLGNLYRITTSQGHVKWVCLEHYKASYREIAMKSFLQTVEVSQGLYDAQLRKVTITLTSSIAAKEFFRQLANQAPAVNELEVQFAWGFGSSDLSRMTESLARTHVRILKVDLQDNDSTARSDIRLLSKGKYHPLLELLSSVSNLQRGSGNNNNNNCHRGIQKLTLQGMDYFGSRTSNSWGGGHQYLPSSLRVLHHLNLIRNSDQSRLANIWSRCSNLVELKLGTRQMSEIHPELCLAFGALKQLQVLHMSCMVGENNQPINKLLLSLSAATEVLRELVLVKVKIAPLDLQEAVQTFANTLEVLVVDELYLALWDMFPPHWEGLLEARESTNSHQVVGEMIEDKEQKEEGEEDEESIWDEKEGLNEPTGRQGLIYTKKEVPRETESKKTPSSSSSSSTARRRTLPKDTPFLKLRRLHLNTIICDRSIKLLGQILPHLDLVQLGLYGTKQVSLLPCIHFDSLQSVDMQSMSVSYLQPLWDAIAQPHSIIESLSLRDLEDMELLPAVLTNITTPLKRLWIGWTDKMRAMPEGRRPFPTPHRRMLFEDINDRDRGNNHNNSSTDSLSTLTPTLTAVSPPSHSTSLQVIEPPKVPHLPGQGPQQISPQGHQPLDDLNHERIILPVYTRQERRQQPYLMRSKWLDNLLYDLDFSRLETLGLVQCGFDQSAEQVLASRMMDYSDALQIYLGDREFHTSSRFAPSTKSSSGSRTADSYKLSGSAGGIENESLLPSGRVHSFRGIDYVSLRYELMTSVYH
ncbi:hypothetical protein EDD11_009460 [Mortierella claussenii]|nr:hypothetical protein EDD11_009460 [Mortierella claussenii]